MGKTLHQDDLALMDMIAPFQSTESLVDTERRMRDAVNASFGKHGVSIDALPDSRFEPVAILPPIAGSA